MIRVYLVKLLTCACSLVDASISPEGQQEAAMALAELFCQAGKHEDALDVSASQRHTGADDLEQRNNCSIHSVI